MRIVGFRAVSMTLVMVLVGGVALAYVPPSSFLMNKLAAQRSRAGLNRLTVTMQCQEGSVAVHEERWFFKIPGHVRRERSPESVEICDRGKCWIKTQKEKPSQRPEWAYLSYLFFVEGNVPGSRYTELLESLKINTGRDTIARFHGRVAIVLGAKEWERDRPQFWLDKDTFLPLRLMVKENQALVEILWIDWGSRAGGDWFPSVIEVRSDGKIQERCETIKVEAQSPVPDELFKLSPG